MTLVLTPSQTHQHNHTGALVFLLFILLGVVCRPGLADTFDDAWAAYDQKNYTRAFALFKQLAQKGHKKAQFNLGVLYASGVGTSKNIRQALYWYKQAAQQKHVNAMYNVGYLYQHAKPPVQDYKAAMQWYLKAAKLGSTSALINIGEMYFNGQGLKKNNIEAYAWFSLAASRGRRKGFRNKDLISTKLSPMDLARGESRYRELRPLYLDPFLK